MRRVSDFGSIAKLMIGVMMLAPLHGCVIPGNVKVGDYSLSSALDGITSSKNGKKAWPFIPTDKERMLAEHSYGVMSQAMTAKNVQVGYTPAQRQVAEKNYEGFKAFMASAPQMSEWTARDAITYSEYLSNLMPVADTIIAAQEQQGQKSDAALKQSIVANKGVLVGNMMTIPAHSAVSVNLQAYCADRHFGFPGKTQQPASFLVPASFAQTVPNELAGHMRNASNSIASGKVRMSHDELSHVLWSITEAGNFTQENTNIFQPSNEKLLTKMSPGLYRDFNAYNTAEAVKKGQQVGHVYGKDREDIVSATSVVNLPVRNSAQNYPAGMFGPNTYYHVTNNVFSPALSVYNAGSTEMKVDLSRYGLVNDGSVNTQKLIIAGVSTENGSQKGNGKTSGADSDSFALAKNIAMDIERLTISKGGEALGVMGHNPAFLANQNNLIKKMGSKLFKNFLRKAPMTSAMVALNEGVTGKDFISGRDMTGIERGLAFLEATPIPGARAEAMATKLNWNKVASAINAYGNSVRGSLYWEAAGFGLEGYKQTLGNTGDYLANKWSDKAFQTEGEKALIYINGSGAAIDKLFAQYGG